MANRVLLGKRGSDFGLSVSRSGVDVTNTSLTTPLSFDTNASASLLVHSFGEGALVPTDPANASYSIGGVTYTASSIEISHGLGYKPAFAVRWCTPRELDGNNRATKVWTPFFQLTTDVVSEEDEEAGTDEEIYEGFMGLTARVLNSSPFKIEINNEMGAGETISSLATSGTDAFGAICLYSYVIFTEPNFTNGESL
tara:strand:- start:2228 stop:2818 length:591 start_codon:yes stop_codon:yes gene_type:complete